MLNKIAEMLGGKLSPDLWTYVMLGGVVLAFVVTLVIGLVAGEFKQIKGIMKSVVAKPAAAIVALKKLPPVLKAHYKAARMGNIKPSGLLTREACVDEPYRNSALSKLWLVTFIATVIFGFAAVFVRPFGKVDGGSAESAAESMMSGMTGMYIAPLLVLLVGGLLTAVGAILGMVMHGGAVKLYSKFMPLIDGERPAAESTPAYAAANANVGGQAYAPEAQPAYDAQPQQQQAYADAQPTYDAQPAYDPQPQSDYAEQQPVYDDPQPMYGEPQPSFAEPVTEPVESDAEIRRRAREEALAQARAQQAAQAQSQQQQQQSFAQPTMSTADEIVARIDAIERDGATRDAMRDVAMQLQKERAKPENKTPERVKQLNDALSRLLKAMSGAKK